MLPQVVDGLNTIIRMKVLCQGQSTSQASANSSFKFGCMTHPSSYVSFSSAPQSRISVLPPEFPSLSHLTAPSLGPSIRAPPPFDLFFFHLRYSHPSPTLYWHFLSLDFTFFIIKLSHRQRSLVDYSPWDCKGSDMTEQLHFLFLSFY